jgi:hypothetical protein
MISCSRHKPLPNNGINESLSHAAKALRDRSYCKMFFETFLRPIERCPSDTRLWTWRKKRKTSSLRRDWGLVYEASSPNWTNSTRPNWTRNMTQAPRLLRVSGMRMGYADREYIILVGPIVLGSRNAICRAEFQMRRRRELMGYDANEKKQSDGKKN